MSKRKDLTPTRKVRLTFKESAPLDPMGDVFNISVQSPLQIDSKNMVQHGSIKPGSTWFNMVQSNQVQSNQVQSNQVQHGSEPGSTAPGKPISLGQLFVLRIIADKEATPYEPVTLKKSDIAKATDLTLDGVKTAIRRLFQRGALESVAHKDGRKFGGTTYKLTMTAREILSSKAVRNLTGFNVVQHGSEPGSTRDTSSSGIDLYKTTTTENSDREKISAPTNSDPAWEKIDFECLIEIGFKQAHVAQVKSWGTHSPKSLQDSIYAFKFDLNENKRGEAIREPLNFLMGILRKGPYTPPANYESPEDRQLRGYLEAKEKLLDQRRERLNRLKSVEFEEWADSLSPSEIQKLAPMGTSSQLKRSQLMNHFDENIWEKKKQEILERLRTKMDGGAGSADQYIVPKKTEYDIGSVPPLKPPATRATYDF